MNTNHAIRRVACIVLFSLAAATTRAQGPAGAGGWQPLFNGKDLQGWTPKITGCPLGENYGNTFRVENGVLKVAYDQYDAFGGRFGHLFFKTPFSHYQPQLDDQDPDAKKLLAKGAERMIGGGSISLQSESHPVEFRKVELKRLDGTPAK